MATQEQLATRILRRLKAVGLRQTPNGDALAKGLEHLRSAHHAFEVEKLVRWTLADIPPQVEEAYVLCGAALGASDWGAPADPAWFPTGLRMVQAYVHIPISGPSTVENF